MITKYLSFRPSREKDEEEEDNADRETVNQTTKMYLGKVKSTVLPGGRMESGERGMAAGG